MTTLRELRRRREEQYLSNETPWDTGITPPEVKNFWAGRAAGALAIDLGCGTGTNAAYLARRNDRVLGIDFAFTGLAIAQQRLARLPEVHNRIELIQADVARLPLANLRAGYILDIGCLHGILPEDRPLYAQSVLANLQRGGYYHLYGFDRPDPADVPEDLPPWQGLGPEEVTALFAPALTVIDIAVGEERSRTTRWYLLQRR